MPEYVSDMLKCGIVSTTVWFRRVSIVKLGENASEGVRIVAEMASCDVINVRNPLNHCEWSRHCALSIIVYHIESSEL